MTLISYLKQKQQSLFFRSAPPPYSHKGFDKLSFKKKAFTLAEVLITLTIIGVVAAMTIPTLMSKYQKHTYVVGLKKAYSQLQNAWQMIPISEGCPAGDYNCVGDVYNNGMELLSKQFKVGVPLGTCKYKIPGYNHEYECFQNTDGLVVFSPGYALSTFGIDLNGTKGPNKSGRDIFFFKIISEWESTNYLPDVKPYSLIPQGKEVMDRCTTQNVEKSRYFEEHGCTAKVLFENAMNY